MGPFKRSRKRSRNSYDSISTETRRALMRLTMEQGQSIRHACKLLQIKYSTGKTLVQLYKKTGRIDRLKKVRERTSDANGVYKHRKREAVVAEVM